MKGEGVSATIDVHDAGYEVTVASPDGGALEADASSDPADEIVGTRIQPFWIEDEARAIDGTNFIVAGRFRSHAVRDGNPVTGQQQHSGAAAARLVIEALGR